jgi:hypothetical protein
VNTWPGDKKILYADSGEKITPEPGFLWMPNRYKPNAKY